MVKQNHKEKVIKSYSEISKFINDLNTANFMAEVCRDYDNNIIINLHTFEILEGEHLDIWDEFVGHSSEDERPNEYTIEWVPKELGDGMNTKVHRNGDSVARGHILAIRDGELYVCRHIDEDVAAKVGLHLDRNNRIKINKV